MNLIDIDIDCIFVCLLIRKMVRNRNKQLENLCYGNYLVGKY